MKLFLAGDVMTGRGVDQILRHPSSPVLHEPHVKSALGYVELAERAHGPIPRPVDDAYVWGDALAVLDAERPDARIVNLETSITTSDVAAAKGINYRMHPGNAPVLRAAGIDCCALANNHVLDWGESGLLETLDVLAGAGIQGVGAGRDLTAARAPAVWATSAGGRILVFALGATDSGIPRRWGATETRPGVHLISDLSDDSVDSIAQLVGEAKRVGDVAVASIHWGGNWGYQVPPDHRHFAHALIDRAGIDVVHGHSSHHPKAIEVHRERPILYGCGDFFDDYEGITGYERYRDDLVLMYFVTLDAGTCRLARLTMTPLQIDRLRLRHPSSDDVEWMRNVLDRECRSFGHHVARGDKELVLEW